MKPKRSKVVVGRKIIRSDMNQSFWSRITAIAIAQKGVLVQLHVPPAPIRARLDGTLHKKALLQDAFSYMTIQNTLPPDNSVGVVLLNGGDHLLATAKNRPQ